MRLVCVVDEVEFEAKRASAHYCSARCRKRAQRQRAAGVATALPAKPPRPSPEKSVVQPSPAALPSIGVTLEQVTVAELVKVSRLKTPGGVAAVLLARRLDMAGLETGSSMAAVVREHRASLAAALVNGTVENDPVDELKARRETKSKRGRSA